jgi:CBS domain-containing protein
MPFARFGDDAPNNEAGQQRGVADDRARYATRPFWAREAIRDDRQFWPWQFAIDDLEIGAAHGADHGYGYGHSRGHCGPALAKEFAQSNGIRVEHGMSSNVIAATEDTPLSEVASLLEKHRTKRVPF